MKATLGSLTKTHIHKRKPSLLSHKEGKSDQFECIGHISWFKGQQRERTDTLQGTIKWKMNLSIVFFIEDDQAELNISEISISVYPALLRLQVISKLFTRKRNSSVRTSQMSSFIHYSDVSPEACKQAWEPTSNKMGKQSILPSMQV